VAIDTRRPPPDRSSTRSFGITPRSFLTVRRRERPILGVLAARRGCRSDRPDRDGLGTLWAGADIELDRLAIAKRAELVLDDVGLMDEHVRPVLDTDEPKALRGIEPLHFASWHFSYSIRIHISCIGT